MEIAIETANPDDVAQIVRVEHAADTRFATVGLQIVLDLPATGAEDYATAQALGRLFVARRGDGRVVGFAHTEVLDGQAHLEQLSVHPDAAGHGIGARLVKDAEVWALRQGHGRMTLCTYRDVPWNGPYYERLGWRVLPSADLGPELRALRERERVLGLEVQPRQAMVKDLRP